MTKEDFQTIKGEPEWIPCSACRAPVFIARHERTGKPAPLLRPREGGPKPNIVAWWGEDPAYPGKGLEWRYKIVPYAPLDSSNVTLPGSQPQPEFINHFADCPAAAQFRKGK